MSKLTTNYLLRKVFRSLGSTTIAGETWEQILALYIKHLCKSIYFCQRHFNWFQSRFVGSQTLLGKLKSGPNPCVCVGNRTGDPPQPEPATLPLSYAEDALSICSHRFWRNRPLLFHWNVNFSGKRACERANLGRGIFPKFAMAVINFKIKLG